MVRAFWRNSFLLFVTATFGLAQNCLATAYRDDAAPGLADGAGVWVNLWNYPEGNLDSYATGLELNGIKNLFIQTSRSTTPAIKTPEKLGQIIEACHRHGVRVIAWSFAELLNPEADADKMITAAEFTSAKGEHLDAIAPNLEKNLEPQRVEKYSKRIREKLGRNYPMIAVVYSPLNRCREVQRISWPLLAQYYDVIAPMIYWNSKYQKIEPYEYTIETIQKIRELSGKADIEIHAIGDGMGTSVASITEFMKACKAAEATGLSLYPNQKMTEEQTKVLARHTDYLPPNARFRLAAFRDFMQNGGLGVPPKKDPSQSITRRDFYPLIVKNMYAGIVPTKTKNPVHQALVKTCREADAKQSLDILVNYGFLAEPPRELSVDQVLDAQVYPEEAVSLLARIVQGNERNKSSSAAAKHGRKQPRRLDRWFIPSAQAENRTERGISGRPLNYLDVSQMVLQASSGLR